MEPTTAPSKGRRALVGYRWCLVGLAVIMLVLDCVTIGLLDSLTNPRFKYFNGFNVFSGDLAILVVPDVLTIICFALLAFRPQGFAPLKKLSSRVLTGCRVFFSLCLTALVLYGPAMELTAIMDFKSMLDNDPYFLDDPTQALEGYMDFVFCAYSVGPDVDMARKNQHYCQVARARWILGFFLAVLMFGELAWSYFANDFKVQQEKGRMLRPEAGEFKRMPDFQGVA